MPQTHLIAANWKMNGTKAALPVAQTIAAQSRKHANGVIALFPPVTLLPLMAEALAGTGVRLGGQDCHHADFGPYTGDISAAMLKDSGASMVILGHSERRHGHLEPCALVARKARAALRAGIEPIICIGETLDQRQAGLTAQVLRRQLSDSLPDELKDASFHVSYEPVWAIGTGLAASDDQIREAIAIIHQHLDQRFGNGFVGHILYGGSVNPSNARHLLSLEGINGALIGGASLTVETFMPIVAATD
ncbi:triose-phosphate isomerase [Asticcacaulis sp. EMRT-3]|uniref:triose-phosphate isomerase n=1 Tax=Asticcacaulis sp. EMRT-3 TaxID=3040349 RepID=UPI0024AF57A5|nr:triose-phosphate isomerase [Asticcacaulis sp. EMRT-3]MDI7774536.1 triose-phosphate isomerase [Asticcacaulis sp. EMRT-3]